MPCCWLHPKWGVCRRWQINVSISLFLPLLLSLKINFSKPFKVEVLQEYLQNLSLEPPSGGYWSKNYFHDNRYYLPFPLPFTHGCTLEFSRSYTKFDEVMALMSNGMNALVFLGLNFFFLSLVKWFSRDSGWVEELTTMGQGIIWGGVSYMTAFAQNSWNYTRKLGDFYYTVYFT